MPQIYQIREGPLISCHISNCQVRIAKSPVFPSIHPKCLMKWSPNTSAYRDIQEELSLIKSIPLIICGNLRSYASGRTWFFFFCGVVQGQSLKGRQLIHHKESNTGPAFKHFLQNIYNSLRSFARGSQVAMAHKSIKDQFSAFFILGFSRKRRQMKRSSLSESKCQRGARPDLV